MHPLLSRLRDAYRAQGSRMLLVGPRWLIRPEYLVIVRDLGRGTPVFAADGATRWSWLREADVPGVLAIHPVLTEADIRRMWAEGQECLTCWVDGAPVFYRWDTTDPAYLPYLDRTFLPRPGDLLISQAFTHPAYRGRGLLSASSAFAVPRARERGAARVVALVAWWNSPTLHVARDKYGHTVPGTVGYWNVGRWRRYFATGAVRLDGREAIYVEDASGG